MPKRKHPLAKALDVVDKLMRLPAGHELFNEPVDPKALGIDDYFDIVKNPQDLGSIRARLVDGQTSEHKAGHYKTAAEVFTDLNLVWSNAIDYNSRADDSTIVTIAREMEAKTRELWDKAGLLKSPDAVPRRRSSSKQRGDGAGTQGGVGQIVSEQDVPDGFDVELPQSADVELPIRVLSQFRFFSLDVNSAGLWSLEAFRTEQGPAALFGNGRLIAQTGSAPYAELEVQLGPVLDWGIVAEVATPYITVTTPRGAYRLAEPHESYADLYASVIFKSRLCHAAIVALHRTGATAAPAALVDLLVLVFQDLIERFGYQEGLGSDVQSALPFLAEYLRSWAAEADEGPAKKRPKTGDRGTAATAEALPAAARAIVAVLDLMGSDAAAVGRVIMESVARVQGALTTGGAAAAGASAAAARALGDALPANLTAAEAAATLAAAAPPPAALDSAARRAAALEAKRTYEAERRRRKHEAEEVARLAREAHASRSRGMPPKPRRVTPYCSAARLTELLALWDLVGTFADVLWLPPIPLARLDALFFPHEAARAPHSDATGALLRDVYGAFMRLLEGRAGKGAVAPAGPVLQATHTNLLPCVGDHHWQVRMLKVLEGRAFDAAILSEPLGFDAISTMRGADFLVLPTDHRFALINILVLQGLQSDILRDEINARLEDFNAIRNREREEEAKSNKLKRMGRKRREAYLAAVADTAADNGGAGAGTGADDDDDDDAGGDEQAGGDVEDGGGDGGAADGAPQRGLSPQKWWVAAYNSRCGMRRFAGYDALGRRYWLLAGRAGAFQIIVETRPKAPIADTGGEGGPEAVPPEGLADHEDWGVYAGREMYALMAWLKAGGLLEEAPLLRTLERLPMPLPPAPDDPARWRETADAQAPDEADALDAAVPDGYADLIAPELPGVLLQPHTLPREGPSSGEAAATALYTAALLLRYWRHGDPDAGPRAIGELVATLTALRGPTFSPEAPPAAATPSTMRSAALRTEALLAERGAMLDSWAEGDARAAWRDGTASATTLREVARAISEMCRSAAWRRDDVLHRGSFHAYCATQHIPLYFPCIGERVVVVRSGLQTHLKRCNDVIFRPPRAVVVAPAPEPADGAGSDGGEAPEGAAPAPPPDGSVAPAAVAAVDDADAAAAAPPPTAQQAKWASDLEWIASQTTSLRPVERFIVAGTVYVAGDLAEGPASRGDFMTIQRPPTAWLLLVATGNTAVTQRAPLVLPIHADAALPDYVVREEVYDTAVSRRWSAGDRFRMQFGGKKGSWYRGTVAEVKPGAQDKSWDPWEAIKVKWDEGSESSSVPRVSMWEIDVDPNSDEARFVAEKSMIEKAGRAARYAAKHDGDGADFPAGSGTALHALPASDGPSTLSEGSGTPGTGSGGTPTAGAVSSAAAGTVSRRAAAARAPSGVAAVTGASSVPLRPPLLPHPDPEPFSPFHGRPIAAATLAALPGVDEMKVVVSNFVIARGVARFRIPRMTGKELDLRGALDAVIARGGAAAVTAHKAWREVALELGLSEKAPTALRHSYEKCVRCFELYLRAGAYARDAARGCLPPRDAVLTREEQLARWAALGLERPPEYATFIAYPAAAGDGAAGVEELRMQTEAVVSAELAAAAADADTAERVAPSAEEPSPRRGGSEGAAAPPSHDAAALVGRPVWRQWQGYGWFRAEVTGYDPQTCTHTILFNRGESSELEERMNLLDAPVALSWADPDGETASDDDNIANLQMAGASGRPRALAQGASDSSGADRRHSRPNGGAPGKPEAEQLTATGTATSADRGGARPSRTRDGSCVGRAAANGVDEKGAEVVKGGNGDAGRDSWGGVEDGKSAMESANGVHAKRRGPSARGSGLAGVETATHRRVYNGSK